MFIELSLLAAFAAMFFWGIGDFLIQRVVRKIGDVEALAFIGIIGSIILIPFVFKDLNLLLSKSNLILLLILGVITFFTALANFEALKRGKLSVVDVILEFELPVTILLGFVFFKETLTTLQFVIISFIFLGILLIATKSKNIKNIFKRIEKGVFIGIIAAIGMGVVNFLTATSSKQISPLMAIWVPWVIFTILCLIVIANRKNLKNLITNFKEHSFLIISMGVFDTIAWIFYAFAVLKAEISITTAITESYPAIALFLGLWFNKEKINWHQGLGAMIALASSVLLAIL